MGYLVTGFDLAPDMVTLAERRAAREGVGAQCTFRIADSETFNFPPDFDAVLVYDTLAPRPAAREPSSKTVIAPSSPAANSSSRNPAFYTDATPKTSQPNSASRNVGFSPRALKQTLTRVGFNNIRHYVPTYRAFMDSPWLALKTALYDLAYYFAIAGNTFTSLARRDQAQPLPFIRQSQ